MGAAVSREQQAPNAEGSATANSTDGVIPVAPFGAPMGSLQEYPWVQALMNFKPQSNFSVASAITPANNSTTEGNAAAAEQGEGSSSSSNPLAPPTTAETGGTDKVSAFIGRMFGINLEGPPSRREIGSGSDSSSSSSTPGNHPSFFSLPNFNPPWMPQPQQLNYRIITRPVPEGAPTQPVALGFSFSPAGLLLPYHLGVAHKLEELGILTQYTPLAGASAGALTAVSMGVGLDPSVIIREMHNLAKECRRDGTFTRLHEVLKRQLNEFLPDDVHIRLNTRPAPIVVSYTALVFPVPKGVFVSEYSSKEDVIEVLCASCCVPFYFAKWPSVTCRGTSAVDGYFAVPREKFGCPPLDEVCHRSVSVSPFPASRVGLRSNRGAAAPGGCDPDVISPDLNAKFPHGIKTLFDLALYPGDEHQLEEFYMLGQRDASWWAGREGLATIGVDDAYAEGRAALRQGAPVKVSVDSDYFPPLRPVNPPLVQSPHPPQ